MFVTSPLCGFYRRNYPCLPPFPWNLRIIKGIGTGRFQADVLQIFKKADVLFGIQWSHDRPIFKVPQGFGFGFVWLPGDESDIFWSKPRWNEWKGFGYIDVRLRKWTLSLMVAGERTCTWNSQLPLWVVSAKNRPWNSQNHGSVEKWVLPIWSCPFIYPKNHWTLL